MCAMCSNFSLSSASECGQLPSTRQERVTAYHHHYHQHHSIHWSIPTSELTLQYHAVPHNMPTSLPATQVTTSETPSLARSPSSSGQVSDQYTNTRWWSKQHQRQVAWCIYVLCEGLSEFMFERIDVRLCNAQCAISGADVCFPVCGRQNSDRVEGKPQSPAQWNSSGWLPAPPPSYGSPSTLL